MGQKAEVHLFSTDSGNHYCLDVNSSAVFAVDKITAEIIQMLSTHSPEYIEAALSCKYPHDLVTQGLKLVRNFQANGFLGVNTKREQIESCSDRYKPNLLGLSLFVSNLCNLNCIYCFNDGGSLDRVDSQFMHPEVAEQAVNFLLQNSAGPVGIDFFGGEPLLNFGLIKHVVQYCQTLGRQFQFSMIINGTLVTNEIADFFQQYGFHIVVSYDSYLQNVQRPSRNGQDLRECIRRSISVLADRLPRKDISIRCILTHDLQDLQLLVDEACQLGVRLVPGLVALPIGNPLNLTDEDMEKLKAFEEAYLTHALMKGNIDHLTGFTGVANTIIRVMKTKQRYYSCGIGKDILGISSQGDIYPCHRFIGNSEFKMGNIFQGIDVSAYNRYVDLFVDNRESCSECWARYFCGGGCAHEAYTYENDATKPAKMRCDLIRHEIELGIKLYIMAIEKYPECLGKIIEFYGE